MASDDLVPEEVDRLVKELAAPPKRPAPMPPVAPRVAVETPAPAVERGTLAPGRPWTTARLLMPAARTEPRKTPAFVSALRLPAWSQMAFARLSAIQPGALSARLFVGLGVAYGAAMPYWPYAHAWSWGLLAYFLAAMFLVATGIWGAKLTWDERLPAAHTIAVGTVLWGLGLIAAEAVPRIGFA
jgi:hypothetical protein